ENLVLVVAMQLVMVSGVRVVVDPGVHLARVHDHCALSFTQSNFPRVDDVNCHPYFSYSAVIAANLITLAHFSVSLGISLPKSAGEPASTVPPKSASCALSLGSARPALISRLSLSTISDGVFRGAPMPKKPLASKPGTDSPTVGMSGKTSKRSAAVTASARSLPVRMYSIDADGPTNRTCTCPAIKSVIASAPPR